MGIDLKRITFSIILALLGVGLIVIGAAKKLSIATNNIEVSEMPFRLALVVLGVMLLLGACVFHIIESENRKNQSGRKLLPPTTGVVVSYNTAAAIRPTAESFFSTLDDKDIASFPSRVEGAVRVQILSRTVVNLVSQYGYILASLAKSGCDIEILVVDPKSDAARHVYGSNYSLFLQNAEVGISHLAQLQSRYHDRIHVRFFSYVPTLSILNVEMPDVSQSYTQVQMYFINSALGRDRPIFKVSRMDRWYSIFRQEFDSIWKLFPDANLVADQSRA